MWDCAVADAVYVEPVSTANFPGNREKNSDFCKIAAYGTGGAANIAVVTRLTVQIP